MKRVKINWNQILPGQVIQFNYTSPKESGWREVLVLTSPLNAMAWTHRTDGEVTKVIHGIQLSVNRLPTLRGPKLEKVFEYFNGLVPAEKEGMEYERLVVENMKQIYPKMRPFIKQNDVYRTFDVEQLKKISVYLLDYEFPKRILRRG